MSKRKSKHGPRRIPKSLAPEGRTEREVNPERPWISSTVRRWAATDPDRLHVAGGPSDPRWVVQFRIDDPQRDPYAVVVVVGAPTQDVAESRAMEYLNQSLAKVDLQLDREPSEGAEAPQTVEITGFFGLGSMLTWRWLNPENPDDPQSEEQAREQADNLANFFAEHLENDPASAPTMLAFLIDALIRTCAQAEPHWAVRWMTQCLSVMEEYVRDIRGTALCYLHGKEWSVERMRQYSSTDARRFWRSVEDRVGIEAILNCDLAGLQRGRAADGTWKWRYRSPDAEPAPKPHAPSPRGDGANGVTG
jgi:hypothetical protein